MSSAPVKSRFNQSAICSCISVVVLLLVVGVPHIAWAQDTPEDRADFQIWKSVLDAPTTDPATQQASAQRLLNSEWPAAVELLSTYLAAADRPLRLRAICAAIKQSSDPPQPLSKVLLNLLSTAPRDLQPAIADALSAYSTSVLPELLAPLADDQAPEALRLAHIAAATRFTEVEVVDALIALLDDENPPALRDAALQALRSITGIDHGSAMNRWQAWWRSKRLQGRDGLVDNKIAALEARYAQAQQRNLELTHDVTALQNELINALSRSYALTESEQRFGLLASWLEHSRSAVRILALDLVEQRILNAEPVPPAFAESVTKLVLGDPALSVRAEAINCLALLDLELAAATVGPMLSADLDTRLEEPVFTVLARRAHPQAVPELLNRFHGPASSRLVSQAVLTACAQSLVSIEHCNLLAQSLLERSVAPRDFAPIEIELLAWSDSASAREALAKVLDEAQVTPERKLAAARGIAASKHHIELLHTYAGDPVVQPFAINWAVQNPSVDHLRMLANWPMHDEQAFTTAIAQIMSALKPAHWLAADDILASVDQITITSRIGWLARILTINTADEEDENGQVPPTALQPDQLRAIRTRLAQLHYETGDADALLAVVQAAPETAVQDPQFARYRSIALAATGQWDDDGPAPPIEVILEALALILREENPRLEVAQSLVDRIAPQTAQSLDPEAQARLTTLTQRLHTLLDQRSNVDAGDGGA